MYAFKQPGWHTPPFGEVREWSVTIPVRTWPQMINMGAPATEADRVVQKIGRFFPPPCAHFRKRVTLVGFWFGPTSKLPCEVAFDWAKRQGLFPTSPYHVFALAEEMPHFRQVLARNEYGVGLLATSASRGEEHPYYVGVWSLTNGKVSSLAVKSTENWGDKTWFIFVTEKWEGL